MSSAYNIKKRQLYNIVVDGRRSDIFALRSIALVNAEDSDDCCSPQSVTFETPAIALEARLF